MINTKKRNSIIYPNFFPSPHTLQQFFETKNSKISRIVSIELRSLLERVLSKAAAAFHREQTHLSSHAIHIYIYIKAAARCIVKIKRRSRDWLSKLHVFRSGRIFNGRRRRSGERERERIGTSRSHVIVRDSTRIDGDGSAPWSLEGGLNKSFSRDNPRRVCHFISSS